MLDDIEIKSAELKKFLLLCFEKDPAKRAKVKQLLESDYIRNSVEY